MRHDYKFPRSMSEAFGPHFGRGLSVKEDWNRSLTPNLLGWASIVLACLLAALVFTSDDTGANSNETVNHGTHNRSVK
jgi:hypothetical protein